MENTLQKKEQQKNKRHAGKLVLYGLLILLLMVGIAFAVARIVHKTSSEKVENGLSAYELAEKYGYEGSIQDWLDSLNGKSAYEIAVENGYSGTEKEWA